MKARFVLALLCAAGWGHAPAAAAVLDWKFVGIINDGRNKLAILEERGAPASLLREGERTGGRQPGMEVVRIEPESGSVVVRLNARTETLALEAAPAVLAKQPALVLKAARTESALAAYQVMANRTVVRSSLLPEGNFDVVIASTTTRSNMNWFLRLALLDQQIWVEDYSDKFAVAVAIKQTNMLAAIKPPPPANGGPEPAAIPPPQAKPGQEEVIPAGMIRMQNVGPEAVKEIYAELVQRTILRPGNLPAGKITLHTQTGCRRDEAVWLLETALRLADIAVENHGDKFVYFGPPDMARLVPKFNPNAAKGEAKFTARIEPAGVVILWPPPPNGPQAKPPPPPAGHLQLLRLYSDASGREALLEPPEPDGINIQWRTQAPLTAGEMIYALEAMGALNGFAFELVGEKGVRLKGAKRPGKPLVF